MMIEATYRGKVKRFPAHWCVRKFLEETSVPKKLYGHDMTLTSRELRGDTWYCEIVPT